ncbi:MAG: DUF2281 domain-containing protein [Planctomycetes bacterium]|nr:DUF2281 domain-containing protein [Planctomycetota bacterium]
MKTIHTRMTLDADGHLRLDIPVGGAGEEIEFTLVVQPVAPGTSRRKPGSAKGVLEMRSEDDEHVEDFKEYMS